MRIYNRCLGNRKILINIIRKELVRNKNKFEDLKSVFIYDVDERKNNTALRWFYKSIRINLAELLNLYKNPCLHSRGTPAINKFSKYILYAFYHEVGHYKLKEWYYNYNSGNYTQSRSKFELKADKFSRLYLRKRGIIND